MNFSKLQELAQLGKLPKKLQNANVPFVSAANMGKHTGALLLAVLKLIKLMPEHLHPGDRVSVDQIESPAQGMIDTYSGQLKSARYHAASLYTDHASHFIFIKCHYSTGGAEAVQGKQRFEQLAALFGVKIKSYRADNGIMAKKEFMQNVELCQQTITLSGANNHSQNGIAEQNIHTVCDRAQTMLCHAIS
jgi:hypothetical protein